MKHALYEDLSNTLDQVLKFKPSANLLDIHDPTQLPSVPIRIHL